MHLFKLTASTLILASSLTLSAQAKENLELHEDQWKNVVVHEKRTVADESVSQWGAWVEVAPTAAGFGGISAPAVGFAPAAAPAVYRPIAEVTAPVVSIKPLGPGGGIGRECRKKRC